MYNNGTLRPILNNGKFFDLFPESGSPVIISYERINKEILINSDEGCFVFGETKKRKKICSICTLRQVFDELVCLEIDLLNKYNGYNIFTNSDSGDKELIIDQLIFDVLSRKYKAESPLMTLQQYSIYQGQYNRNDQTEKERTESIRKCISNGIKKQTAKMNSPELRSQIIKQGTNPDKYLKNFSQLSMPFTNGGKQKIHKKPKVQWDYIFYNANDKVITGKQYDRSFSKNRNYSHKAFVDLFNTYDQYIDELFMHPEENSKSYFLKSLDFYYFETYKRLDFIYKFAVLLDKLNLPKIENHCLFADRFTPEICYIVDQDGSVMFDYISGYYRPMVMLENTRIEKFCEEPIDVFKWEKYNFIRAKMYELFQYHFMFTSNNYDEMSDFIKTRYNILDYHDPNKIWIQADRKLKREREARIIKALEINEILFGRSDKPKEISWMPLNNEWKY